MYNVLVCPVTSNENLLFSYPNMSLQNTKKWGNFFGMGKLILLQLEL